MKFYLIYTLLPCLAFSATAAKTCTPSGNPGACDDGGGTRVCRAIRGASDVRHLKVTGSGFASTGACLYIFDAAGTQKGDVIIHGGNDGTTPMQDFNADYTNAGFRVTDIAWDKAWEDAGTRVPASILNASGKMKAVLDWGYQKIRGSAHTPFCGQGFSGGSGAMLYAMTHYGEGDATLDHVIVIAASPFGRIDQGCDLSSPKAATTVCSGVKNISPFYDEAAASVGLWTKNLACGTANPSNAAMTAWQNQSIVSNGEQTVFTKTSLSAFYCQNDPNETVPLGTYVFGSNNTNLSITLPTTFYNYDGTVRCAPNVPCRPQIVCAPLSAQCSGESVFTDAVMKAEIVTDMQHNCVNRH